MATEQANIGSGTYKVTVHILRGKSARRSREMTSSRMLIGSGPHCDVQMRSPEVANRHCEIERFPAAVTARQLDDRFPLLLNGTPIVEAEIRDGDVLQIGPFELSITIEGMAAPASALSTPPERKTLPTAEVPTDSKLSALARIVRQHPGAFTGQTNGSSAAADVTPRPRALTGVLHQEPMTIGKTLADDLAEQRKHLEEEQRAHHQAMQELARREQTIAAKEAELAAKEVDRTRAEEALHQDRMRASEDLLVLDRQKEEHGKHKAKLHRVRRRLLDHYRARLADLEKLNSGVDERAAELEKEYRKKEEEIAHWRRVGTELGERQVALKRLEEEIAARETELTQREKQIQARLQEIEQSADNHKTKERLLEQVKAELEDKKARNAREEARIKLERQSADEELARIRDVIAEADKKFEEAEAKLRVLTQQEEHLKGLAAELEEQRLGQVERDRQLAMRGADVEASEATFQAREDELRKQKQELGIKSSEIHEQTLALDRRQRELERMDRENADERLLLEQRAADLEEHARAIFDRFEIERQSVAAQKQEMAREKADLAKEREQLEADKNQWVVRAAEVQEAQAQIAEREGLLRTRAKSLETVEVQQKFQLDQLRQHEETLVAEKEGLARERQHLQTLVAETNRMADSLKAESARLHDQAQGLQERQRELIERERQWCDEVKRRRTDLEHLAEEVERKRSSITAQAQAHRRQIHKLREVGQKAIQRRKQSATLVEQLERRHHVYQQRLEAMTENQQRILESVLGFVDLTAQREQEATRWLETIRSKSKDLFELQQSVGAKVSLLLSSHLEPESNQVAARQAHLRELEETVNLWSDRLWDFQRTLTEQEAAIERREREAESGKQELADLVTMVEQLSTSPRPPAKLRVLADSDAKDGVELHHVLPSPTGPSHVDDLMLPDDDLATRVLRAGLVTPEQLTGARQSAAHRKVPLGLELLTANKLTRYQLSCLYEDRAQDIVVGNATILDLLHEGAVSTIYRARTPRFTEPVALRLYAQRWTRDESRRSAFEISVRPLTALRHPNIATTYELLVSGDRIGVLQEYVEGVSLADLALYACAPRAVMHFCQQVTEALVAAQRSGFVHHNLRPSRILVTRKGQVKLIGYGEPAWLSKIHRCESGRAYSVYTAPEELTVGQPVDIRSDLYAMAQIFLELATGGAPRLDDNYGLPDGYPVEFGQLLHGLAVNTVVEREPTAEEALQQLQSLLSEPSESADPWPELPVIFDQICDDPATSRRLAA